MSLSGRPCLGLLLLPSAAEFHQRRNPFAKRWSPRPCPRSGKGPREGGSHHVLRAAGERALRPQGRSAAAEPPAPFAQPSDIAARPPSPFARPRSDAAQASSRWHSTSSGCRRHSSRSVQASAVAAGACAAAAQPPAAGAQPWAEPPELAPQLLSCERRRLGSRGSCRTSSGSRPASRCSVPAFIGSVPAPSAAAQPLHRQPLRPGRVSPTAEPNSQILHEMRSRAVFWRVRRGRQILGSEDPGRTVFLFGFEQLYPTEVVEFLLEHVERELTSLQEGDTESGKDRFYEPLLRLSECNTVDQLEVLWNPRYWRLESTLADLVIARGPNDTGYMRRGSEEEAGEVIKLMAGPGMARAGASILERAETWAGAQEGLYFAVREPDKDTLAMIRRKALDSVLSTLSIDAELPVLQRDCVEALAYLRDFEGFSRGVVQSPRRRLLCRPCPSLRSST